MSHQVFFYFLFITPTPFFFSLFFLCFFTAAFDFFFSSSLHTDFFFFISFFTPIFFILFSWWVVIVFFGHFWLWFFGLDYFSFSWVFSGFVMFVLLTRFMTWDQRFKYPHQTFKTKIFWLHLWDQSFFFVFVFSLCILLLSIGCSHWILLKEMKMWRGEDAFCWALIFVGCTILLKIEFLKWNTHWEFPAKHTTNRVMGKLN